MTRHNPMPPESQKSRRGFISHLVAGIVGASFLVIVDLMIGFWLPGPVLESSGEILAVMVVIAARLLTVGLVIGFLSAALGMCPPGWSAKGWRSPLVWIVAGGLSIGFVVVNRSTFDGGQISGHRYIDAIVWGFRIAGVLGIFVSVVLTTWLLRRARTSGWIRVRLAVGASIVVGVLLHQNARLLVGLYPMLHTQLVLTALLLSHVFVGGALIRNRRFCWSVMAVALVVGSSGLALRQMDVYRRIAAAVDARGPGTAELAFVVDPILDRVMPLPDAVPVFLTKDLPQVDTEAQAAADALLEKVLPGRRSMNLLMIAVDTVRADHVGFNGYKGNPTTPVLDRMAEKAWVFRRAYAPYPTSNYSYSSTLNSLYPRSTEVHGLLRKKDFKFTDEQSIAGFLGKRGWHGIGITAFNRLTSARPEWFGTLRRGFEVFNPDQEAAQMAANQVTDSIIKTLDAHEDRPFFLWAHYLDPHSPYLKWDGFDFGDGAIDRYDSEIAWSDANIGRVLQHLEKLDELKNTIVVMFSDHGEEFGEHGGRDHNHGLYEQEIHVPLFIAVPGLSGREIDTPVSLVDIVPTLLAILGQDDTVRRHGRNLLPLMLDPKRKDFGTVFAEHYVLTGGHDEDTKKAVIHGNKKLIQRVEKRIDEIFDLGVDQGERRNLVGRDDATEGVLRGLMKSYDDLVDRHHLTEGAELLSKDEEYRRKISTELVAFGDKDHLVSRKAWVELKHVLLDYVGNVPIGARQSLGEDGLARLSLQLCEAAEKAPNFGRQSQALWLVGMIRNEAAVPYLKEQVKKRNPVSLVAAIALARMGNDTGEDILKLALTLNLPGGVIPDKREMATCLARLGNDASLPWVRANLATADWGLIGRLAQSISYLNNPELMLRVRDLYTENHWRPVPVRQALAACLGRLHEDPEARWLLYLMTHDSSPVIRGPARIAAQGAGLSVEDIARAEPAAKLEQDGILAVVNRKYALAFKLYGEALEKGIWFNGGLRLRLARYLHLEGHSKEARIELQKIIDAPEATSHDKAVAARRIEGLSSPPRLYAPEDLKIEVESLEVPAHLPNGRSALSRLRVKNTGATAWQGGFWQFRIGFAIRWEDSDGNLLPQSKTPHVFLPEAGVLPGESVELTVPTYSPKARDQKVRPVLRFFQDWLTLPNEGIVYRAEQLIQLGKDRTKKPEKKSSGVPGKKKETSQQDGQGGGIAPGWKVVRIESSQSMATAVVHPEVPITTLDSDGRPIVSESGFVALKDEGTGFYYGSLVEDQVEYKRSRGIVGFNNWGDIEAMALAGRVVSTWRAKYPDGPRLGIDEISGPFGGFPDFDGDGISDHKTHQTGCNINFLLPCRERPERTIHVGRRNDALYDPALLRDLIDTLVDVGAYRMTTNSGLALLDAGARRRHEWDEVANSANGFSTTYRTGQKSVRLYLLHGKGEHGDHVNTMLWKPDQ